MREDTKHVRPRHLVIAGSIAGAVVFIVALLLHIQTLSNRISELQTQTVTLQTKLAAYNRTLCSGEPDVVKVNALQQYTVQSAGYERTYQVHTPANYDPSVRYPVVLSFDGIEGSGGRMRAYSSLDSLPAIVVYPDSLKGTKGYTAWQGAPYSVQGDRDIQFVRQLLEELPSRYCVDSTRQYVVGMSNGGAFATIVGCELGDQIKAVASVSGAFYTTCQREQRTPSLLVMHSVNDGQVPFMGEATRRLPKIQQWVNEQAVRRGCNGNVLSNIKSAEAYYNWIDCDDNSILRFVVLRGQPHGWLSIPQTPGTESITTADYIWKFFEDSQYNDAN